MCPQRESFIGLMLLLVITVTMYEQRDLNGIKSRGVVRNAKEDK